MPDNKAGSADQSEKDSTGINPPPIGGDEDANAESIRRYQELVEKPGYVDSIVKAATRYFAVESLEKGDVVQWKPQLKPFHIPDYGRPMVYLGEVDPARAHRTLALPGPFWEPQDALVGFVDGDNDFVILQVDSARLTKWPEQFPPEQ